MLASLFPNISHTVNTTDLQWKEFRAAWEEASLKEKSNFLNLSTPEGFTQPSYLEALFEKPHLFLSLFEGTEQGPESKIIFKDTSLPIAARTTLNLLQKVEHLSDKKLSAYVFTLPSLYEEVYYQLGRQVLMGTKTKIKKHNHPSFDNFFSELRIRHKEALPHTPLKQEVYQLLERLKHLFMRPSREPVEQFLSSLVDYIQNFEDRTQVLSQPEGVYFCAYATIIQNYQTGQAGDNFKKLFLAQKKFSSYDKLIVHNILNEKTPYLNTTEAKNLEIDLFQRGLFLLELVPQLKKSKAKVERLILDTLIAPQTPSALMSVSSRPSFKI